MTVREHLVAAVRVRAARHAYATVPVLVAAALFVVNVVLSPSFVSSSQWATNLSVMCPFVLTSIAAAPPMIGGGGGIDLSIGPFLGFVVVFVASVLAPAGLGSPEVLLPLVLAFGLAAGAVNGIMVAYLRLPAIIATLGTYLFYAGISAQVLPTPGGTVPSWVIGMNASYGPVPGVLVVFAGVAVVWTLVSKTAFRRNLLAVGGEERAAYTAGINVARVRLLTYAFAGMFAALAGLVLLGLLQSGDATVGAPYTLSAITGVALGGVILSGGHGGLFGAALGGLILYLIQTLMTVSGVSVFELSIANGVLLVVALALNGVLSHLQAREDRRPLSLLRIFAIGAREA